MSQIVANLSSKSIQRMIAEVRRIQSALPGAVSAARLDLAQEGREYAEQLLSIGDHQSLVGSTKINHTESFTTLYSDKSYAAYFEYGTGIVGKGNPHPVPESSKWIYDINDHGHEGWHYVLGGKVYWTKGLLSYPYMYMTGEYLRNRWGPHVRNRLRATR